MKTLGFSVIALLVFTLPGVAAGEATILFTKVPRAGAGDKSRGNIEGKVSNLAEPQSYRIVLYAHTDKWYVQPLANEYLTRIHRDGKWSNWTHLGDRYAALVVRAPFRAAPVLESLPDVGGDVLAEEEVAAKDADH